MGLMVFDLDGTLVDSLPDITGAVNEMLAARRLPPLTPDAVRPMVGDGLAPLMDRVFAAAGAERDEEAGAEYLARYEARIADETRLFPGMEAALDSLAAAGWRLAVCTNKPERASRALLDALGIASRFAAVGGGDSFPARKPDPRHLLATIDAAGADRQDAVMVGDHANDIAAGTGADLPTIFCAWGYGRPGMEKGASSVAHTPGELPSVAGGLRRAEARASEGAALGP